MRIFNRLRPRALSGELFGGVTAAVVALPLALAFGVASCAGAAAGLYGAVAVGFFAALFGGTPSQISGPTGPMTVVFAAIIALHADNLGEAFAIVAIGGLIQILFGLAGLGRYIRYTPVSVVSGFMTGIGVIIITMQIAPLFGAPSQASPSAAITALPDLPALLQRDAAIVGLIALGCMIAWPARLGRFLPAPLAALILATLAAVFVFKEAPRIGDIPSGLPSFIAPVIPIADIPGVLSAALALALLGSIDSLLTSLVADSMTRTAHDSNRELVGQGLGNVAAGLIGGLPGAGATMRTVVNIRSGGATALSGMVHAAVLAGVALGLGPLAAQAPLAALAGILLKVGWDIIDWGNLRRLHRAPREKAAVMVLTLTLTVAVDLITAVAVGLIAAGFVTARQREREELDRITEVGPDTDELSADERALLNAAAAAPYILRLTGSFSFASAREMQRRAISDAGPLLLDLTGLGHADLSAALAIEEIIATAAARNQSVFVAMRTESSPALARLGVLDRVAEERRFDNRADALRALLAAQADPSQR